MSKQGVESAAEAGKGKCRVVQLDDLYVVMVLGYSEVLKDAKHLCFLISVKEEMKICS